MVIEKPMNNRVDKLISEDSLEFKMKNILLLISVMFMSMVSNAQLNYDNWDIIPVTDEFERPTGDTASIIFCKGTFSNSATSKNPKFTAKIVHYYKSETISISLYEYNTAPSASIGYKGLVGTVKALVGSGPDGISKSYENVFAPKSGGLYITKKSNPIMFQDIINGEYIYFIVMESLFGESGRSSYNFKLILK